MKKFFVTVIVAEVDTSKEDFDEFVAKQKEAVDDLNVYKTQGDKDVVRSVSAHYQVFDEVPSWAQTQQKEEVNPNQTKLEFDGWDSDN